METKQNQHGERAATIVVGFKRIRVRAPTARGTWKAIEILACPVTWRPHPEQIASARRGYDDWWQALDWVRDGLMVGRMLREVEVTAAMPKVLPWKR
jgi:thiazole synthase ThiGH ThiG subunit